MHIRERDISLYLDNRLDSEKQRKLEEHFSVCRKCSERLAEWKELYAYLEGLEYDFELDGLENKIMQKIKNVPVNVVWHDEFRISVPVLLYVLSVVLSLNLLFEPVINFLRRFYNNTMAFMLNESLEFINSAKWEAVDVIALFKSMEITGMATGIVLIAGGIYFTVNRKSLRKV
ncbi:hypothetical protein Cst_c24200 [Thermoclostridium stercorarium subsp. stercorarium DSM 8532]|jgi:hypothetical protein|uniref:Anti-sigma-W factor RsiW n=2 Tax=Thermoclostridium stercorarium TaxID=1510 RepID=L7VMC9_THES1|nr:zf-HC2 domain-containing protein [Thermoclostridium stercorarium]AGC69380.1 hypothetical protein Cst_c24200 [Thermoclostridium stercorarium subsp. stercorarium DSM 8532]AGI40340.1 zinc-finger domain-containing protein [Thermoclostridium stercorarium subsp. stercorarium DSM 8532]ANW99635.1 hypothetical protein CSTERTH_11610 [Thermoclostridium stercorarium subsp. thermolacticum DSM 2910]UZQ85338.1 zf-HC2 domain-containing protein [Thermoclostridium stercorarium]